MKIKKLKKLIAGVLSAAMVMSTMAVTAFAAEPDTILQPTGTLTITKYEGNNEGTPLADVEFTMYKLADITQTVGADGTVDTKATPVSEVSGKLTASDLADIANGTSSTDEWNSLLEKISLSDLTVYNTATTNTSGVANFKDVAIGIYAVAETDAPSQVISKSANFIVSIPMTTDGDSWNYDVEAKPKNQTAYGAVSLLKQGKTGNSGTLSNLQGVQFALQQKSGASWTTINDNLVTGENGIISVPNLAPAVYRFIETGIGDNNGGYILDGAETYEFELKIDSMDNQTHIWYDSDRDGTKEDKGSDGYTINAVNEKPTLDKTVKDGDSYEDATDASVGDTITWKVSASVPSKVDELKVYKLTDKMSNALTWVNETSAELTIATTPAITGGSLIATTDYTLTKPNDNTPGGTWTIEFTEAGRKKLADNNVTAIDVTFKTLLNSNANIGSTGNLNDAQLDYSNAIYPTTDTSNPNNGKNPGTDVIKDQAIVYAFGIGIVKVDGTNITTKLSGVTFDLYSYDGEATTVTETVLKEGGTPIKVSEKVADTAGQYVVDPAGNDTLTTDTNGKINVEGLKNGNYYLVETKTNEGYNLLKDPVKVQINVTYETKSETKITKDSSGNVTSTTTVSTKTFTGGKDNSGVYEITIENNKGFSLPVTGGTGTLLASLIGILLMGGGAFVFISSRKKKKAE